MKKLRLLVILFLLFNSIIVADQWYKSNSLAMQIQMLSPAELIDHDWLLYKSIQGQREVHTLYFENEEIERKEIWRNPNGELEEEYYRNGVLDERIVYDTYGNIIRDDLYYLGSLDLQIIYTYEFGLLKYKELYSAEEELIEKQIFYRYEDGSLRKIVYEDFEGEVKTIGWSSPLLGNEALTEWTAEGDRIEYSNLNDQGQPLLNREFYEDDMVSEISSQYNGDGEIIEQIEIDFDSNRRVEQKYGEFGIESERVYFDDKLESITRYFYDNGLLQRKESSGKQRFETWDYTYNEDNISEISYSLNRELNQVTRYLENETKEIEYYSDGEIRILLTYINGTEVSREYLRDGEVFRTIGASE